MIDETASQPSKIAFPIFVTDISSEEDYAVLGTWEGDAAPWSNFKDAITTVAFSTPVAAKTCTYMFSGCTNLNAVYLDNFYTNEVTDMSCMFANCTSLEVIEFGMATALQDEEAFYAKGMFTWGLAMEQGEDDKGINPIRSLK